MVRKTFISDGIYHFYNSDVMPGLDFVSVVAKAFYCLIRFAFGNIFFSRSWHMVCSFDKASRSAFISFLKIVAIFTDCFGGQKFLMALEGTALHNAHQDDRVAIILSPDLCSVWPGWHFDTTDNAGWPKTTDMRVARANYGVGVLSCSILLCSLFPS